jgi:hypothetical protein
VTTETTTAATKKAAEKVVAAAQESLPTVIETAELALEVPTKVIMKTPLVVAVSVAAGTALGVGGLILFTKVRTRLAEKKVAAQLDEDLKAEQAV